MDTVSFVTMVTSHDDFWQKFAKVRCIILNKKCVSKL